MWKILRLLCTFSWHPGNMFASLLFDPSPSSSLGLTPCHTWKVFHPSQPGGFPQGFLFYHKNGSDLFCFLSGLSSKPEAGLVRHWPRGHKTVHWEYPRFHLCLSWSVNGQMAIWWLFFTELESTISQTRKKSVEWLCGNSVTNSHEITIQLFDWLFTNLMDGEWMMNDRRIAIWPFTLKLKLKQNLRYFKFT